MNKFKSVCKHCGYVNRIVSMHCPPPPVCESCKRATTPYEVESDAPPTERQWIGFLLIVIAILAPFSLVFLHLA